ncbi:MAG: DUF3080 domain-containing protein, partial [Pseudomonadales bacterium]|nr:DUF3080 domain-containing protein [Pseudomonadales bacterium]
MAYWYALKRLASLQSALAGCLMLTLLGCQQKPNDLAVFDEYLNRVEGTFDLDLQDIGEDRDTLQARLRYLPPRPERRDTLLELPPITIGLLQFADLYGCELQVLIGERNSVLGKVMHTSRRLDYESRLFHALYACMASTLDADFSTTEKQAFLSGLLELQQQKKQQLPAVIWNS